MVNSVTKSDIVKRITDKHPSIYSKDVQSVVNLVLDEVVDALSSGRRVELRGFGAFSVRQRKARIARNPKTEKVVQLGTRYVIYFRAGKELKEKLNDE